MSGLFDLTHLILYAIFGVLFVAVNFGGSALTWLSSLPGKAVATVEAATGAAGHDDEDYLDLQAYNRLKARYVRLGCKEGQAAMETAGQHFLHSEGKA